MSLRPKIVKLARMIGGVPGMLNKIDENAPEYYALECVVTDDMADVALCAGLRKPRTMEYLAQKSGKSMEEWVNALTLDVKGGQTCEIPADGLENIDPAYNLASLFKTMQEDE